MKKQIYKKGEKIRRYKMADQGSWSCYKDALSLKDMDFFRYAATKGYVIFGNDSSRGESLENISRLSRTSRARSLKKRCP